MVSSSPAINTGVPSINEEQRSALRFDAIIVGFYALFFFGIFLDAWAHSHGRVDESFFTPWHAAMYGSFTLLVLFVGGTMVRGRRNGQALTRALPRGYETLLIGIGMFGVGGLGDMVWHTLFGVETDIEALFSPSHLLLACGVAMIVGAPLRSAILRARPAQAIRLWAFLPTLLSMTFLLSVISLMGSPMHPLNMVDVPSRVASDNVLSMFASGIWVHTALMIGIVLLAMRTWKLPFGALTLLIVINGAFMCIIRDAFWVLPYLAVAALVAEGAVVLLKPSAERPLQFRIAAMVIPVLVLTGFFTAIALNNGIAWSVHLWTGMIASGGFIGLMLSYLVLPITPEQRV